MSLLFDTDGEYVDFSAFPDNLSPLSIIVWCKPTIIDTYYRRLYCKGIATGDHTAFILTDTWNGSVPNTFSFSFEYNGNADYANGVSNSVTLNTWQYLCGTWTGPGNYPKLYNGDLTTLVSLTSLSSSDNALNPVDYDDSARTMRLGSPQDGVNRWYAGNIAALAVFEKVLSLAELQMVQFKFSNALAVSDLKLLIFPGYHSTAGVPDLSGNLVNGTISGATVDDFIPLGPLFSNKVQNSSNKNNPTRSYVSTTSSVLSGDIMFHINKNVLFT